MLLPGFVFLSANYRINAGDLSVIRPFVYCRESLMTGFAKDSSLPVINENCPACFEEPKERARMKKLLSKEESLYPNFYDNIRRAMLPLMHDDSTDILRSYTEEALAKSRKENQKKHRPAFLPREPNRSKSNEESEEKKEGPFECSDETPTSTALSDYSEDELVKELARRRVEKYRLAGAMKRTDDDEYDPTGQVCTLNGGNGSIPCRELME
jgi:tRNA(Ile)-lysidine synthase TilS/MesJ